MAISAVFAGVSLVQALRGGPEMVPAYGSTGMLLPAQFANLALAGLLRAVIFGVLAGVAFFTGLACFFWSAVVEAREQRAAILERLAGPRQPAD